MSLCQRTRSPTAQNQTWTTLHRLRIDPAPEENKIAYCKSSNNRGHYSQISFDFLGHTFKPRLCKNRQGKFFVAFTPAISRKSAKKVRDKIASWPILRNSKANLNAIASYSRAILQGWKNYYGKYGRAELKRVLFYFNEKLVRWAKRKYKRLKTERRAVRWIIGYRQREPKLFVHWSFT